MKFRESICCLLASANLVLFVNCLELNTVAGIAAIDEGNDEARWHSEKKLVKKGLKWMNEKGELVEVTTDDTPPPGSTRRSFAKNIYFYLYTRFNPIEEYLLTMNSRSSIKDLSWSYFNYLKPTFFITHGWLNGANSSSCVLIRRALLWNHDVNVIVVDWSSIAKSHYGWAVEHVEFVGKKVAEMIKFLIAHARMDPDKVTLVGHSLGAHIMGIAGYYTNGIINSIFGLDPAFPMFRLATPGSRLSSSDAKHVQIIHTNAGFLGFEEPIGHTDFYPDGGTNQLSCTLDLGGSCSHGRAYEFFAESLNTTSGFYGRHCESKTKFISGDCKSTDIGRMGGLKSEPQLQGTYYLWTKRQAPYARGIDD